MLMIVRLMSGFQKSLYEILKLKVEMLCNGLEIEESTIEKIKEKGIQFDFGRKGGAGPAGGRYFKFPNGSIVNTPLYHAPSPYSRFKIADISESFQVKLQKLSNKESKNDNKIHNGPQLEISEPLPPIKLIPTPKFYQHNSTEGIPFKKIALMHGDSTMATTVNQRCKYWTGNQQCKFCGIELSLKSGATIEQKTSAQLVETITSARRENPTFASHITLTIGTQPSKDKGMAHYEQIVTDLRKNFHDLQIHIQIEPMQDTSWYERLKQAGADTVGIHLEILNDEIRNNICPGKSKITKDIYFQHWKEALRVFGPDQVSTFIITGFEPDLTGFLTELEQVIKLGVVPLITPVRIISGTQMEPRYSNPVEFLKIIEFAAEKCREYGVNPLKNKAGCIRCGGCSPILDAYRYFSP